MKHSKAQKALCAKRQSIRLHIEALKSTLTHLEHRRQHHKQDSLSFLAADNAVWKLSDKIAKAERELTFFEKNWRA